MAPSSCFRAWIAISETNTATFAEAAQQSRSRRAVASPFPCSQARGRSAETRGGCEVATSEVDRGNTDCFAEIVSAT